MNFKTGLFTLIAALLLTGLLFILPTIVTLLWYFVLFLLIGGALSLIGFVVLSGLIAKERLLTAKAERKIKEHVIQQDGHGMLYLINLSTGHSQNLTTDPRFYRNGHFEQPQALELSRHDVVISKGRMLPAESASRMVLDQNAPQLLSVLNGLERVLVKGPSNAGKTTLFQNIAAQSPNCIVIDPHFTPGIWPKHCTIIGAGRNHSEIDSFFQWLSSELGRRYKLRAQGDESYPLLTIIIDEWMSISSECRLAEKTIVEMITESRKAKMRLFVGSHSDQVEALGIKGQGKLREGLLVVRLYFDQFTQERSATFDYGKGERPCIAPASFSLVELALPQFCLPEFEPLSENKDDKILALIQSGATDKEIAQEIFNKAYLSGDNFYRVKQLRNSSFS